jgi:transketolase
LRLALRAALEDDSPTYIRIGKKGEADIHPNPPKFKIGKAIIVRPGNDVLILCAGNMMLETLKAADILAANRISAEVVSFHTVKPLDESYLQSASIRYKLMATVEEHGRIGGFGSAVSEWRASTNCNLQQISFGADDEFMHEVGSQVYARKKYGLTAENIATRVIEALKK